MSWRGIEGGIAAAKEKHDVIMTPTSHAYFDYYQAGNTDEPLAIGGFLPLKKVYSFNPIPEELNSDETQYVLGAQGNIWTEYIKTEDKLEYMVYPRILAMSEVVWSGASENIDVDYSDFLTRLEPFMDRLSALDINYANHLYEIEGSIVKKEGAVFYELKTATEGKEIQYKLNNSELLNYEGLIPITEDATISANVFKNGSKVGRPFEETIQFHKGLKANISLNTEPHKAYSSGGKEALINGIQGSDSRYGDKEWLGFWGDDLEITIDFAEETEINIVTLRFYDANGQWIYLPNEVAITSKPIKGKSVSCMRVLKSKEGKSIVEISFPFDSIKTTGLTISVPNYGMIPTGLQGAGNKAWTFIDEIVIE
jgi:hexosaminidase